MQTACQVELFTVEWVFKACSKHVRKTEYKAVSDYRAIWQTHLHLLNSIKDSSLRSEKRCGVLRGGFFSPLILKPFILPVIYGNNKNGIDQSMV